MRTPPMTFARPVTVIGSLRILRAMAELTKTEAQADASTPQAVTEALDDTLDALDSAIATVLRVNAFANPVTTLPHPVTAPRTRGYCACGAQLLGDLLGDGYDDGITMHTKRICDSHGETVTRPTTRVETVTSSSDPAVSAWAQALRPADSLVGGQ